MNQQQTIDQQSQIYEEQKLDNKSQTNPSTQDQKSEQDLIENLQKHNLQDDEGEEEEEVPIAKNKFSILKDIDKIEVVKSRMQQRIATGQFLKKSSTQTYEKEGGSGADDVRPHKIHFQDDMCNKKEIAGSQPFKKAPPIINTRVQMLKKKGTFESVKTPTRSSFSQKTTTNMKNMGQFANRWKTLKDNPLIQLQVLENMSEKQFKEICKDGIDFSMMIDIFQLFENIDYNQDMKIRYMEFIPTLKQFDVNMKALLLDEKIC